MTANAKTTIDIQLGADAGTGDSLSFVLSSVDGTGAAQGTAQTITHTITSTTDYSGLRDAINAESASTGVVATLNTAANSLTLTNDDGHNIHITDVGVIG